MGVLKTLIEREFGVRSYPRINHLVDEIPNVVTPILEQHPDRIAFVVVNLGVNDCYISPDLLTSAAHGVVLGANGGWTSANWKDDLDLVGLEWRGVSAAGNMDCLIIELIGVPL